MSLMPAGANFGNIVSMSVSGLILSWTGGAWDTLFYLFGVSGLLWLCLWLKFGYSRPQDHPELSPAERKYLDQYSAKVHMQKVSLYPLLVILPHMYDSAEKL